MDEEFRVAIGEDGDLEGRDFDDGPSLQITALTVLILGLLGLLLALVGVQSVETERHFFKQLTLETNSEIADLLSQQFVQAFSSATGLVEDLSRFPSVRRSMSGEPDPSNDQLLDIITSRNPVLRSLALRDRAGTSRHRSLAVNASEPRAFPDDLREVLLSGRDAATLSAQYMGGGGKLCIGFGAAVLPPKDVGDPAGTVEAELSLEFLHRLVDSVQIGATGRVLVVDRDKNVVFSSAGFRTDQVQDFRSFFPADRAFTDGGGGITYGPPKEPQRYLTAYRAVKSITRKGLDAEVLLSQATFMPTFTSTIRPNELPSWMIVVQQDFDEGIALASRMKMNILLLVGIGLVGLLVIARLWWDSLHL